MIANPCGLFAKNIFYDKYTISKLENNSWVNIEIYDTNIAWN